MRSVTYSMGVSLDGYIVGPDGNFDWFAPDGEVFRFWIDEVREVGVHLMGRRLYETMLYWETADQDLSLDDAELEWTALWKPLPKVVFSTTLSAVEGNARLASDGLAEEIERLRTNEGEGDIAIGGATLAAEAAAFGLIDEYRVMVHPVLVGGGIPFFPQRERRVDLELVETRTFSSKFVYLRYRVGALGRLDHLRGRQEPGRVPSVVAEGGDQLVLVHVGAPLDADLLGLVVEVLFGPLLIGRRLTSSLGGSPAVGVGDPGRLLLAHSVFTQSLVLLVVVDRLAMVLRHPRLLARLHS
jgi:dihydrofolate reductase